MCRMIWFLLIKFWSSIRYKAMYKFLYQTLKTGNTCLLNHQICFIGIRPKKHFTIFLAFITFVGLITNFECILFSVYILKRYNRNKYIPLSVFVDQVKIKHNQNWPCSKFDPFLILKSLSLFSRSWLLLQYRQI